MARILMAGLPAFGLANPSLPLAAALVEAGHTVDFLQGESFRQRVERTGATLIPFGFYLDGPLTDPRQLIRHGKRLFTDMSDAMIKLGPQYDAVVGTGIQPQLPRVERALDRPVIFASPVFFQNDRTAKHLAAISTGLPAPARRLFRTPALRRVAAAVGGAVVFGTQLGDLINLLGPRSSTLNLTVASREYQPFPDDFPGAVFMGPTPTQRISDPDFPLDRLRAHDGPVFYATLGTVFNTWTPFFRTIAEAFAGTDHLVVLTTGSQEGLAKLGDVPDNVIARAFVPQVDVLEHADVCFTHGGFGTATDAVTLGVPPVLTPMGADQFFNAYRLEELGAGTVLPKGGFTVESVRKAADDAMTGDRSGLNALRESFVAAGGPKLGVSAIEAVL